MRRDEFISFLCNSLQTRDAATIVKLAKSTFEELPQRRLEIDAEMMKTGGIEQSSWRAGF